MLRAAPLHGRIDFYSTPDSLVHLIRHPNAYGSNPSINAITYGLFRTISLEGLNDYGIRDGNTEVTD